MKKTKKLYFSLLFLLLFVFIFGANFVLAANLPEIQYPAIPFSGIETPNQFMQKIIDGVYLPEKALPLYIKYFYYLALTIAGLLVLGAIIYSGFQYVISGGNPVKMVDARQRITAGISGLVILFSSYIILTTINPQLAIFNFGAPQIEKCDCSKPITELSEYCQRTCQVIIQPSEEIPTYIEIPIGRIIERVMQASKDAKDIASLTKSAAEELEKKVKELKDEASKCNDKCGGITTTCDSGCSGGACLINGISDCPNKTAIEQKTNEQRAAIQKLETKKNELIIASVILRNEKTKLELAEAAMRDSFSSPISFEDFISIKQTKIRKINPWLDVNKEIDPLKDVRSQISPDLPGFDGSEDPATFYISEKENIDLIRSIEFAFSPIIPPACQGGETRPYTTCDGSSCRTINSCGISSCANDSECSAPPPPFCPEGTIRPYTTCDGSSCRTINSCGISSCNGDSDCSAPPPPISGACYIPDQGPCSILNLLPYFNNDYSKAVKAAQICYKESGGDICALNPREGLSEGWFANPSCPTCDYSVGIFQLNLLAGTRCSAGLEASCPKGGPFRCSVLNKNEVANCRVDYGFCDPAANIRQAVRISNNGTNWCPWSAACPKYCGICPDPASCP